jgi:hypothetical protein
MGKIVDLKPALIEDDELIENLARFADGTLSEAAVKARHHLSSEEWAAMGESDRLVELVEAAKLRRIRTGTTKREGANRDRRRTANSAKSCAPAATHGTSLMQSKHSIRWPAPAPAAAAEHALNNHKFRADTGVDHIEHFSKSIAVDANDGNSTAALRRRIQATSR